MINFIIRAIVIALIATPIYLLVRRPWRFKSKKEIFLAIFVVYLICLFALVFKGRYQSPDLMIIDAINRIKTGEMINLVPFRTMIGILSWSSFDEIMINDFSNIVIFIPWGFFLPCLWERFRNPKSIALMCLR